MSWRSLLGYNQGAQQSPIAAPSQWGQSQPRQYTPFTPGNPFGSGGLGSSFTPPKQPYAPENDLGRGQVTLPFSGPDQQSGAGTNKGDIGGSIGGSLSDLQSHLNIGNAVPYTMERTASLADKFGESILGKATPGGLNLNPLDALLGGVKAVSDVAGPVLDYLPNLARDANLNQQVSNYRGLSQLKQQAAAGKYPGADASTLEAMSNITSLPDEVKKALDANPNLTQAEVDKLLDTYGRQWSYSQGPAGFAINLLATGLTYAPELIAGGAALGAVKGAGEGLAAGSRLAQVWNGMSKTATVAAKLQKFALATGGTTMALTTAMDTVARVSGDQAMLTYWDQIAQTTPISSDPNVQLVTSFTTNPFSPALKALKGVKMTLPGGEVRNVGILPLAKGLGRVLVPQPLAKRMWQLYTSDTRVEDVLGMTFQKSRAEITDMIGPGKQWENRAAATEQVVKAAMDEATRSLPLEQRVAFEKAYPDRIARTKAILEQFPTQVMAAIDDPKALARRIQEYAWQHHGYLGGFKPEKALENSLDYTTAGGRTYDALSRMDAVLGYPEYLHPQASAEIRSALSVEGDAVSVDWVNGWIEQRPAVAKLTQGLVTPEMIAADSIPKSVINQMVDIGDRAYADALRKSPWKTTHGSDPVLTTDSTPADRAKALGTSEQVYNDVYSNPAAVKAFGPLRDYVTQRYAPGPEVNLHSLTPEQVAALSDEQVWQKAYDYTNKTMEPWLANGARGQAATTAYARLSKTLAKAEASGDAAGATRIRRQMSDLSENLRLVRDPAVPFTQKMADLKTTIGKNKRDVQMTQAAMDKVDAMTTLDELAALQAELAGAHEMGADVLSYLRRNREGDWAWAGSSPAMPNSIYARLEDFVQRKPAMAETDFPGAMKTSLSESGDGRLWDMARAFSNDPEFLKGLTKTEKNTLRNRLSTFKAGGSLGDLQELWRGGTMHEEDALAELSRLRDAYDNILSGRTIREVKQSANKIVPQDYIDSVNGPEGVVRDPGFEAYTHLRNIERLSNLLASENVTADAALQILADDPALYRAAFGPEGLMVRRERELGRTFTIDSFLNDDALKYGLLKELIPVDFVPPTPGVIVSTGPLDQALIDGDATAVAANAQVPPISVEPITAVPAAQAKALVRGKPSERYTRQITKRLDGIDGNSPLPAWADQDRVGTDTLSTILWGHAGSPPNTVRGLIDALGEIESGRATTTIGLGDGVLAEAQRVGRKALDSYAGSVEAGAFPPGVMMQGLNPAAFGEEFQGIMRELVGNGITLDGNVGLQYGFKKAPKGAMVTALDQIPGAADEFMAGHFQPFEERLFGARITQGLYRIFGPYSNAQMRAETKSRFNNSVIEAGGTSQLGDEIWQAFNDYHLASKDPKLVITTAGRKYVGGDKAYFADIRNIPNNKLDAIVQGDGRVSGVLSDHYGSWEAAPESLRNLNFADTFREASSFTRRTLKGMPIGDQLASLYGHVAHNSGVTTLYYQFRFGMDLRFHAMNAFEPTFLYLGEAAFRPGLQDGMFGMTQGAVNRYSESAMANTGFPFAGSRAQFTWKTLLKKQEGTDLGVLKTIKAEDPEAFRRAMEQLAEVDPELKNSIAMMGDTPKTWLHEMDNYYGKLMKSADPEGMVDGIIARETARTPELAEVLSQINKANQDLLTDIRGTFFGNPNRSQFERVMNSYLLFWPISYQIKAAKWLMRTLFDSVGGLKTGAFGGYALNQIHGYYEDRLQNDPVFASTIASNSTLLFAAQMLFPLDPTQPLAWSLSPILRNQFFGGSKAIWNIGPIYTLTGLLPDAAAEVYRQTSDVPIWRDIYTAAYPALTGMQPGEKKLTVGTKKTAPIDTAGDLSQYMQPLDTSNRFGQ